VKQTLSDLEVSLDAISRAALDQVDPLAGVRVEAPTIEVGTVPVRRTFVDFLLFRGKGRVRRDVFGPPEAPRESILAATNQKRLGARGREALKQALLERLDAFL